MMCHVPRASNLSAYHPTSLSSHGSCHARASFQTLIPWLP